jgi:hypothetical protein
MKKVFLAAALATLMVSAHASDDYDDGRWFGTGLAWYEHPCGLQAFAKYGQDDTPAVRRAYEITRDNPAMCSTLFP